MSFVYQPSNPADFQQPPWQPPFYRRDPGKAMSVTSLVCSGIGFLVIPLLFGTVAAIFAGLGLSKGEGTIAKWAMGVALVNVGIGAVALLVALNGIDPAMGGF